MADCGSQVFVLLVLTSVVCVASQHVQAPYQVKYFDQFIDHFNLVTFGNLTYKQRYLVNDQWWAPGKGPIFFYTGNEGNIEAFWNNSGFIFEIAPIFRALVIFVEHRFYGGSLPFGNQSFQLQFVGLLTIEQALADYAVLLTSLKSSLGAEKCPVIAFGGSYGGMLSAYMRAKYPHIIDGAIAASAPVYMNVPEFPRDFFFPRVTKDFRDISPKCEQGVRDGFSLLKLWASQGSAGMRKITKVFNLCSPAKEEADYRHLLLWIRNAFTSLAMGDYPYPTTFIANLPAYPVKYACTAMANANSTAEGLFEMSEMVYGKLKCHNIWNEFIECADPTGCGLGMDSLAWDFQACTEIILPAGSDNVTDMFPILQFTLQQRDTYCQNRWGVVPRNAWMATHFFTTGLKGVSNIVFSNGNLDPWMGGGITTNISSNLVAVVIDGGAHHLDLRGSNAADPPSVVVARIQEAQYISKWIKQAKKTTKIFYQ